MLGCLGFGMLRLFPESGDKKVADRTCMQSSRRTYYMTCSAGGLISCKTFSTYMYVCMYVFGPGTSQSNKNF